jgi:hypothetical protein
MAEFEFEIEIDDQTKRARSLSEGSDTGTIQWNPGPLVDDATLPVESEASAQKIGQRLFESLFDGMVAQHFERARPGNKGRIVLVSRSAKLSQLPWEYTYDASRNAFLFKNYDLVRYPPLSAENALPPETDSMRILIIPATPRDLPVRNVLDEQRVIADAFAQYPPEKVSVVALERGTWQAVDAATRQQPFDVLHFIGHGAFLADGGKSYFAFEDETTKNQHPVSIEDLTGVLRLEQTRLIVLNSCQGATGGNSSVYSSGASALVQKGGLSVVAMQRDVPNSVAERFAASFYAGIAGGRDVGRAVTEARNTLVVDFPGQPAWGIPVVFAGTRQRIRFRALDRTERDGSDSPQNELRHVAEIFRLAREQFAHDPARFQQLSVQFVETMFAYLSRQELGAEPLEQPLAASMRRLRTKGTIQRPEERAIAAVCYSTSADGTASRSRTDVDSSSKALNHLARWFFGHVRRPDLGPQGERGQRSFTQDLPDEEPTNFTISVSGRTRLPSDTGELIPIWRPYPGVHRLSFPIFEKELTINNPERTYWIGRSPERPGGGRNDFVLPDDSVSRSAAALRVRHGEVSIENTSDKPFLSINGVPVPAGSSQALRCCDHVRLGNAFGRFYDGRYFDSTPATAVEPRTGLLSQHGMTEVIRFVLAQAAFAKQTPVLLVLRPVSEAVGSGPEESAAQLAVQLHRLEPLIPIGRAGACVMMLLPAKDLAETYTTIAVTRLGTLCASGWLPLRGPPREATASVEASLGAMKRRAIGGDDPRSPVDLSGYALRRLGLDDFALAARKLISTGGGAAVFALGDVGILHQHVPDAVPTLEQELAEVIGSRMGPRDVIAKTVEGAIAFGTSGDVERVAYEISRVWRDRPPIVTGRFALDRTLRTHLLVDTDLGDLENGLRRLAHDTVDSLGLSGFPAPLALGARAVAEARDARGRARALVNLVERIWQFLALVLAAHARMARLPNDSPPLGHHDWPEPWRAQALFWADRLAKTDRAANLAAAVCSLRDDAKLASELRLLEQFARASDGPPQTDALEGELANVERSIRQIVERLRPLREWTLVSIEATEGADPVGEGTAQLIEFVDYTGAAMNQTMHRFTFDDPKPLVHCPYLVRWGDEAVALEPFVRRMRSQATGRYELLLAMNPIAQPGSHRFQSIISGYEITLEVTAKQLSWSST